MRAVSGFAMEPTKSLPVYSEPWSPKAEAIPEVAASLEEAFRAAERTVQAFREREGFERGRQV